MQLLVAPQLAGVLQVSVPLLAGLTAAVGVMAGKAEKLAVTVQAPVTVPVV